MCVRTLSNAFTSLSSDSPSSCSWIFTRAWADASLPIILAGGTKLGLKHGRHVDFNQTPDFKGYDKHPAIHFKPVNEKARLSNVLLTMAQKMDVKTEKFGDSTGIVSEVQA